MRKDESISIISEGMKCTKKSVEELMKDIDKAIEVLTPSLEIKDKVKIGSYITLEKVLVAERLRRNPNTGEEFLVPEHEEIKIGRTQAFKDLIK